MVWLILLCLLLLFILVLVIRALRLKPEKVEEIEAKPEVFDHDKAVADLQQLIRCKTVSHGDPTLDDEHEFEKLISLLPELFPQVHRTCTFLMPGPRSLVFHWKGKTSEKPAVLMAHFDVVPVDEKGWDRDPFGAEIIDDVMWGRGTLDTKSTFLGVLEAADNLIGQGYVPARDLYLCFSGTEEVNGDGAPAIVRWLKQNGIHPDFILDEGGAIVENVFPGVKEPAAVVGIAEKGTMAVRLSVPTGGGHASTPPKLSSIGRLAKAVRKVEDHPFPAHLSDAAHATFRGMASHASFGFRILFANLWCFRPLLYRICSISGGELNALVRTTVAFTQMQGSDAFNVMPPCPSIVCNVRVNCGETTETVLARLRDVISDDKIQIDMLYGRNPSETSSTEGEPWQRLVRAVHAEYPGTMVTPYLMLASSDAWNYCAVSDHVFRLSPMPMSKRERGMIHGNNEQIPLSSIHSVVSFYMRLMRMC
ncbi:MAG: M20/M25/M40 family metallo-hydrolase [Clostridia bacterium]|nr:M20/M25/M40 family metallo-hydrolase [Clostridia bacterium]